MKNLFICALIAAVATALVGCGSKGDDGAPLDTKDQLTEMRSKVPAGTPTVAPEQASQGFNVMGSNAGVKKRGN